VGPYKDVKEVCGLSIDPADENYSTESINCLLNEISVEGQISKTLRLFSGYGISTLSSSMY
jgi:hypothetical protein